MQSPPERPRLRPLESQWIQHGGQPALVLRDRLALSDQAAVLPPPLALLLSLCDGSRDLAAIRTAFALRTGLELTPTQVAHALAQFDAALLLEGPRLAAALEAALADYRAGPARPAALAGRVYPADAAACHAALDAYAAAAADVPTGPPVWEAPAGPADGEVVGVVCPHIDYPRGGPVYARVWSAAAAAARRAEVVVVLGTDHLGGPARLTPTRQSYATPFGTLPTAQDVVDALADAVGEEAAFGEELHHRNEHSIELALVWLHDALAAGADGAAGCQVVPILCGSLHRFVDGTAEPAERQGLETALAALRRALAGRRAFVVAAADLGHVGPAFGDPQPLGPPERAELAAADGQLLRATCAGDAAAVLGAVAAAGDRWRVCGLPPIYAALRLLAPGRGELLAYDQCPADDQGGSWVSVAGLLLRSDGTGGLARLE